MKTHIILVAAFFALSLGQVMASKEDGENNQSGTINGNMDTESLEVVEEYSNRQPPRLLLLEQLNDQAQEISLQLQGVIDSGHRQLQILRVSRDESVRADNDSCLSQEDLEKGCPCFNCTGTNYLFWRTLRWDRYNLVDLAFGIPIGIFGLIDGINIGYAFLEIFLESTNSLVPSSQNVHLAMTDSEAFTISWHFAVYLVAFTYLCLRSCMVDRNGCLHEYVS